MAALSGQKVVTTAGTEVALGSQRINGPLAVKALADNGDTVYLGNAGDGTVGSGSGFELGAGEVVVFDYVGDLSSIMVDAALDACGVCWLALGAL